MKIAVASDDRVSISQHFGRTSGFLIFTINENEIAEKTYLENSFTGHAQGQHHEHGHDNDQYHPHQHHHSHSNILDALQDCEVVISRGMGRRLLEDFEWVGKKVFVTWTENAELAVKQFIEGNLHHDPNKSCQH